MEYTIKNDYLSVTARTAGAELQSIKGADGTEYLWQADPKYWGAKAHNIFPYVARLTEGKYTLNGKQYEMKIHGIARYVDFTVEEHAADSMTFRLDSNEELKKAYPYDYIYRITYRLEGKQLITEHKLENLDTETMHFAIGGHPGFNVPLEEGLAFEDYYLEFEQPSHPHRVLFTDACAVTGNEMAYPLADGHRILLKHELFDHDAIVLKHADRKVRIASDKGTRSVTVSYPDFMYVGFWHMPNTDAPYVCVEPWSSLPSRDGIIEEFTQQGDLLRLPAGKTYTNVWTIEME